VAPDAARRAVCAIALGVALLPCGGASRIWIEPTTGMTFVRIDGGRFEMGSPVGEAGREAQEQQHTVVLTRSFWLGAFEVTQAEWQQVMGDNPAWFARPEPGRAAGRGDRLPIENVTLLDVDRFLGRLNSRSAGYVFRLPTEAEWEYACRAGSTTAYADGATLSAARANVAPSPGRAASGSTMPVGSFAPNRWGVYDMPGNVWEWTRDEHCPYTAATTTDPLGVCGSPLHVIRGGSWYFGADSARCALRYTHRPQDRGFSLGFRVLRE
jgi:formylglycine-generating enzyme required for sulfatase activity